MINHKGITLIELIVVMVIIAIGATLMVPSIGAWLPNYRLRSGARDVVSTLRFAQMKAVSTNIPYGVVFDDANSYQLYYQSTAGLIPEGSPINLPSGVQFNNNTFPVNGTLGKHFAQFNPNSMASAGSLTVENPRKGTERRITLSPSTGKVSIR
jgi:prepilin-type N-terminal cleavage/methylation domain-containing protein